MGMSLFKPHPLRIKDLSAAMYDNSKRVGYVYRSDASIGFRDFSVGFSGLSESEADDIEAAAGGADTYIFYPRPGDRKGKHVLRAHRSRTRSIAATTTWPPAPRPSLSTSRRSAARDQRFRRSSRRSGARKQGVRMQQAHPRLAALLERRRIRQ
jgi:hypothetical protein